MAYPAGVSVATVSVGHVVDFFGEAATVQATITPVLSGTGNAKPRHITHAATGQVLTSTKMVVKGEPGGPISFQVPHVDQPGFVDPAGNAVTFWAYEVAIIVVAGEKVEWKKTFQPVVGQAEIDLDLVPDGPVVVQTAAPLPEVIAVNGRTGDVQILEATPETIEAGLPVRLGETQLAAKITGASRVLGPRWVFDGDSITWGGHTYVSDEVGVDGGSAWDTVMAGLSDGRITLVHNAAVPGQRSDGMLARFDTEVAPHQPDVVFSVIGTNDVGGGVSLPTFQANFQAYHDKVAATGAKHVVGAIWPTHNEQAGRIATLRTFNDWVYDWAAANDVLVVPFDLLADPATGGWPAGLTTDGVHPTDYNAIAELAWQTLEPLTGPAVFRRPTINGTDLLANGLMTTLGSGMGLPVLSSATPGTAGTLPAGQYEYKIRARDYWGEGPAVTTAPLTVAASGSVAIVLAPGTPSGNRGFNFYRKAPGGSEFLLVAKIEAGSYGWTDTGAAVPGAAIVDADKDTTVTPVGLTVNSTTPHKLGGGLRTDPRFRGNVIRMTPLDSAATGTADYFVALPVAGGDVIEATVKVATDGVLRAHPTIIMTGGPTVSLNKARLAADAVHVFRQDFTVPAGVTEMRFYLSTSGTDGWVDYGELGLRKVVSA